MTLMSTNKDEFKPHIIHLGWEALLLSVFAFGPYSKLWLRHRQFGSYKINKEV